MLSAMRDNVGGWVAKIFIGLLALSFAVWGISDIFSTDRGSTLVVVGDQEISYTEYEFEFQQRVQQLSRQFGQPVSLDLARSLGIHRQVLADMINNAVIDNQVEALKLAISDDTIAQRIAADPRFHDSQGRFDATGFRQLLAANGMTEQSFAQLERETILRTEIAGALSGGLHIPDALIEAMARQRDESRTVSIFTLPATAISEASDPTDEEQLAYYEENKRSFTAPEYRTLVVLRLEPEDVAESLSVSEEEVRQIYDQRISDYTTAETRDVQQISFQSLDEAQEARDRITAGSDFLAIAEEKGLNPVDYSLGQLEYREIADQAIADTAFTLDAGAVSQPIEGRLAIVLLRVVAIEPETVRTFEEVRPEIESRLGLERAQEEILNLHDAVEDARAEGATLDEIGDQFDLPVNVVDAVDQSGRDPQDNVVENITAASAVLRVAFESDIGIENDPVDTEQEGFVWVDVIEITPPAIRPFEEVSAEIVELWKDQQSGAALLELAQELLERARGGIPLDVLAEEYTAELVSSDPVTRTDTTETLSATAVSNLFRTPLDAFTLAQSADGETFVILQVTSVEAPEFDAEGSVAASLREELISDMNEDFLDQYVSGLQSSIGIEINEDIWQQLHGEQS